VTPLIGIPESSPAGVMRTMEQSSEKANVCMSHIEPLIKQAYKSKKPDESEVRQIVRGMVDENGDITADMYDPESSDYLGVAVTTSSPQKTKSSFTPKNLESVPEEGDTSDKVSLTANYGSEANSGRLVNLMSAVPEDIVEVSNLLTRSGRINRLIIISQRPFKESSSTLKDGTRPDNIKMLDYVDENEVDRFTPNGSETLDEAMSDKWASGMSKPSIKGLEQFTSEATPKEDYQQMASNQDRYSEVEVLIHKDEYTTDELLQMVVDNVGADIDLQDEDNTLKDIAAELAVASKAEE